MDKGLFVLLFFNKGTRTKELLFYSYHKLETLPVGLMFVEEDFVGEASELRQEYYQGQAPLVFDWEAEN